MLSHQTAPDPSRIAALREQAVALHLAGALVSAARLYEQVLRVQPRDFQSLLMAGVLAAQSQEWVKAAELLRCAIGVDDSSPVAHNNLGIVLTEQQRHAEARGSFERAIALSPGYAEAHANRGVALAALGRLDEALAAQERAIALRPDFPAAHGNRGAVLRELGRAAEALQSYEQALALQPDLLKARINRSDVLRSLGRFEEALRDADQALQSAPDLPEALVARGAALQQLDRPGEAVESYRRALTVRPADVTALTQLGAALCELRRPAEALASCEQALALQPDLAEAFIHRGMALHDLQRFEEALASYDHAIARGPRLPAAHNNRGTVLQQLQRYEEALADFDKSIALDANNAEAHFNQSLCLLLLGRLESGWALYEWRKRRRPPIADRALPQPLWRGATPLEGQSLLLHSEQGLGDTIQFCRYARLAAACGARVVLSVPSVLQRLLRTLGPSIEVVVTGAEPATDWHAPLLSLPAAFGTTLETVPAPIPYLSAEPERVKKWRQRIGSEGFRIGIAWQGRVCQADLGRSFPLEQLRRLGRIDGVRLISLQKDRGTEQLQTLPAGMRVERLGDDFDHGPDAFLDTAAVMECLDLVIACDTAVAHLAGALGRPLWIALRHVPDWRWLLQRSDSPWYPSARLFRQTRAGDWDSAFEPMRRALRSIADDP
jgi:tetratricopeptide (TPR) repeat protein